MGKQWLRWGCVAALIGMAAWVIGVALIPLDAKLENGDANLVRLLADASIRLEVATLLAVTGGVLLVVFFVALCQVLPADSDLGGLARLALVACAITQTMVAVGAAFAMVALHQARAVGDAALVAFGWRGLWLTFLASGVPTILFTIPAVVAMNRARLVPQWIGYLGWLSAAAHVVVLTTFAQRGAFAPDGIVAALTPVTTVVWISSAAIAMLRSNSARSTS